jgi:hypothetical protein
VTALTALSDADASTVTVVNVAPVVTAVGDSNSEGGVATVSATFTDPGTLDTHTASILWGDGSPAQMVSVAALASGVQHVYGDNGSYSVTVTVTDDDGGWGGDTVAVQVANAAPELSFDASGAVTFPGGDFLLARAGDALPSAAEGTDAGSDDLRFTWSVGDETVYYNDGSGPDGFPSPFGTFPFAAADSIDAVYAVPGAEVLTVLLADDDGGSDSAGGQVIVTGTAGTTEGAGWWKHQYSGSGSAHLDTPTADGYLEIVNAVSAVFSETVGTTTSADVLQVLSPHPADPRARAVAALMVAWLQFARGAVAWDATVPVGGNQTIAMSDLMFQAEATIANPAATAADLLDAEQLLTRVRHAY